MFGLIMLVVFFIVVAVIIAVMKKQLPLNERNGLSFDSKGTLFTPAERSFLGVLDQALDDRYRVFGNVRLGDIVKSAKGLSKSNRATAQNKINQKHVDFVICTASDLSVVGVIELDDNSHERTDRVDRDEFVDRALSGAKISILHFSAKKGYTLNEVRAKLAESFASNTVSSVSTAVPPVRTSDKPVSVTHVEVEPIGVQPAAATLEPVQLRQEANVPVCPKCESAMVRRQAAKGPHAGKFFWACSAFPKCRQVVAVGEN